MGNWELSRVPPSKPLSREVRDRVFSAYKLQGLARMGHGEPDNSSLNVMYLKPLKMLLQLYSFSQCLFGMCSYNSMFHILVSFCVLSRRWRNYVVSFHRSQKRQLRPDIFPLLSVTVSNSSHSPFFIDTVNFRAVGSRRG